MFFTMVVRIFDFVFSGISNIIYLLSFSLFVGEGACPSRNITRNFAVYSNNMKKHRKSYYFITQPKGHN